MNSWQAVKLMKEMTSVKRHKSQDLVKVTTFIAPTDPRGIYGQTKVKCGICKWNKANLNGCYGVGCTLEHIFIQNLI